MLLRLVYVSISGCSQPPNPVVEFLARPAGYSERARPFMGGAARREHPAGLSFYSRTLKGGKDENSNN